MWQKCPCCNGSGMSELYSPVTHQCSVCNGYKIINQLTGLPPKTTITTSTTVTNADFRDVNMESQQEYLGKT